MNRHPYNTMLKGQRFEVDRSALESRARGEGKRGLVFQHDLSAPLPEAMVDVIRARCRCVYAEVPWRAGWEGFHERADAKPATDYASFLGNVVSVIRGLGIPAFVFCCKAFSRASGVAPRPLMLNGKPGYLYVMGAPDPAPDITATEKLLPVIAATYESVYDPCCGYGNVLRYFQTFAGSDLDGKCVDYCFRELCHA